MAAMQKQAQVGTARPVLQQGTSNLGKHQAIKELLGNLFLHPYRERYYLYILIRKQICLLTQREILSLLLWIISKARENYLIILENKQICSLPGAALQISLNKATHALCSGGLQKCQIHHSTLPFYMSSFHDSQGSLGVRRTQACLSSWT